MSTVNLAKALKMKNSLVGEINRAKEILTRENSRLELTSSKVDREVVYKEILSKTMALVELKTQIAKANIGIYNVLTDMAEVKSMITYLKTLPTLNGIVQIDNYAGVSTEKRYSAFLNQEGVDTIVAKLQKRVEELQDAADTFNATTTITVS